ncbi:hypothetical protein KP509_30G070200 [Ceratopteris richardii]|nr:hypothetical protein KP509_30G070200 [Ceratopteris richardii]
MAAVLNEDSPSLLLEIETRTPRSGNHLGSCSETSVDVRDASDSGNMSYHEADLPRSFSGFSEWLRNELLLNSLRGPVKRANMPAFWQSPKEDELSTSYELLSHGISGPMQSQLQLPVARASGEQLPYSAIGQKLKWLNCTEAQLDGIADIDHKNNILDHHFQAASHTDAGNRELSKSQPTREWGLKTRKEGLSTLKKGSAKSKYARDTGKEPVDLNDLLMQCAQAVGLNNTKRAVEILKKVKRHASPYGNGTERLAFYFAEAMEARFSGTGWALYMGLLRRYTSSAEILRATYMYMASCPFVNAYYHFINQTILNVARGASKLHILELQVDGFNYPALFKAFASWPEGPPHVHLIGIGFPHYSTLPAQTDVVLDSVQKTGKRLTDYAISFGVPFEYTAWAGGRDQLCMQDFVSPHRPKGEVLVIVSASMLRYIMDDTLDSPIVRSKNLKQGRDINPDVYVQGIITGSYSTPFFTRRFREALFHFESVFDMLDTCVKAEDPKRLVFEGEILGKAILNIVACEGAEMVDRIDKYKHWQAVTEEVGFRQLPLDKQIKDNVQRMLGAWHRDYTISEESQYLLMGWKGRMLHAMSSWSACAEEELT